MNPAVLVVAVLVIAVVLISFGNRKQRPILWGAFLVVVLMVLSPPWLGERIVWTRSEAHYRHVPVSMGYAPLWSPPPRHRTNTWRPMRLNWARLFVQVGVVALAATPLVVAFRRKRPTLAMDNEKANS